MKLNIDSVDQFDIPKLVNFAPASWNFNMGDFVAQNMHCENVVVRIIRIEDEVVGVGNLLINQDTAWIGNMIINPVHKRLGFGRAIFKDLIHIGKQKGCSSFLLIATEEGFPLYQKEGFAPEMKYNFYSEPRSIPEEDVGVHEIQRSTWPQAWELDKFVTGEDRKGFLEKYSKGALLVKKGKEIQGVYFPNYGNGSIVALNNEAGLNLLKYRFQENPIKTVLPSSNVAAHDYLCSLGCKITGQAYRMCKPKPILWKPECIFSRGTGYGG